jgi:hypothetical protein
METLTIKIRNKENLKFIKDLLNKFDFVSEVKEQQSLESDLRSRYKELPIVWGYGKPQINDFAGIWKGRDITLKQIRERAWKRI